MFSTFLNCASDGSKLGLIDIESSEFLSRNNQYVSQPEEYLSNSIYELYERKGLRSLDIKPILDGSSPSDFVESSFLNWHGSIRFVAATLAPSNEIRIQNGDLEMIGFHCPPEKDPPCCSLHHEDTTHEPRSQ